MVFPRQRIDPRFDSVYQLEDSASSTYNGFTLSLNQRLSHDVQFLAAYTYSKTIDTASDFDLNKLFGNIEMAPIITLSSGRPVNPLTGADENQGQAFPLTTRPLGLP